MVTTLIVEPAHSGHRFSYVRYLLDHALTGRDSILLTAVGASERNEFRYQLAGQDVTVLERLSGTHPTTRELAESIAAVCADQDIDRVIIMDADNPLKRWWWEASRAFRRLPTRPRVSFLYTRYPLRLPAGQPMLWVRRAAMALLTVLAIGTRTLDHAVALTSRDDRTRGRLVHRVADPATCSADARDRVRLRTQHGLPVERSLVGIFGRVAPDKNVELVAAACWAIGPQVDVVLAGPMDPEVSAWWRDQPDEARDRIIVREGFLTEQVMDELLASCDVIAVTMDYDRPSAIMGKALAAGVPVVSAGSRVRERELAATDGGVSTELDRESLSAGIQRLLDQDPVDRSRLGPEIASPRALALALLDPEGREARRSVEAPPHE